MKLQSKIRETYSLNVSDLAQELSNQFQKEIRETSIGMQYTDDGSVVGEWTRMVLVSDDEQAVMIANELSATSLQPMKPERHPSVDVKQENGRWSIVKKDEVISWMNITTECICCVICCVFYVSWYVACINPLTG